jgi:hypothetical protein
MDNDAIQSIITPWIIFRARIGAKGATGQQRNERRHAQDRR